MCKPYVQETSDGFLITKDEESVIIRKSQGKVWIWTGNMVAEMSTEAAYALANALMRDAPKEEVKRLARVYKKISE